MRAVVKKKKKKRSKKEKKRKRRKKKKKARRTTEATIIKKCLFPVSSKLLCICYYASIVFIISHDISALLCLIMPEENQLEENSDNFDIRRVTNELISGGAAGALGVFIGGCICHSAENTKIAI
jgi:hypothetical protein